MGAVPLDAHRLHTVTATPRIVSLLPSATEIICALGLERHLVGRSHECDFPPEVAALPVCTRAHIEDTSSREIDNQVKQRLHQGLSLYDVDTDRLRSLSPDWILTQDQCKVCAVPLSEVETAVAQSLGHETSLLSLSPRTLGDVWNDITRVGEALDHKNAATRVTTELANRVAEIAEQTSGQAQRPKVVCLEWLDPLMAAGNWVPELVTLAGGEPLFGEIGEHSPWLEWDSLRDADPDLIVLTACGFDRVRTRAELGPLLALPGWEDLAAVREDRVYIADGNAYFNRSGPRLVESLEILAELLHPEHFPPRHEGSGFESLSRVNRPEPQGD